MTAPVPSPRPAFHLGLLRTEAAHLEDDGLRVHDLERRQPPRAAPGAKLIAENPRYRPIYIRTESAMIQGVVVGLMRAYRSSTSIGLATKAGLKTFKETHAHRA